MNGVMQEDLVSVIIPFYRGRKWLEEAIESVLAQTYKNIELIVVVDGSPEDISSLEGKYEGQVIFIYQKNQGAAGARNVGIEKAKGEYLAFLDADDLWLPKKISIQIEYMKREKKVWCHGDYIRFWEDKSKREKYFSCNVEGYIYPKCLLWCPIATPNVVILKRALVDNPDFRFGVGVEWGEDSILWQKMGRVYPLGYLPYALSKVRMRGWNAASLASKQLISRGKSLFLLFKERHHCDSSFYWSLLPAFLWCYVMSLPVKIICGTSFKNDWKEVVSKCLYLPAFLWMKILKWAYFSMRKKN